MTFSLFYCLSELCHAAGLFTRACGQWASGGHTKKRDQKPTSFVASERRLSNNRACGPQFITLVWRRKPNSCLQKALYGQMHADSSPEEHTTPQLKLGNCPCRGRHDYLPHDSFSKRLTLSGTLRTDLLQRMRQQSRYHTLSCPCER